MHPTHGPYDPRLIDYFLRAPHSGRLPDATGSALVRYPVCGDTARLFVRVEDGTVTAASFQAAGCGPVIACCAFACERIIGRPMSEAASLTPEDVARPLRLPRPKMHCAQLAVDGIQGALRDDQARHAGKAGGEAP